MKENRAISMSDFDEEVKKLNIKIGELDKEITSDKYEIASAKKDGWSEAYLINLGQQLTELMKTKNILLDKSQQKGEVLF